MGWRRGGKGERWRELQERGKQRRWQEIQTASIKERRKAQLNRLKAQARRKSHEREGKYTRECNSM